MNNNIIDVNLYNSTESTCCKRELKKRKILITGKDSYVGMSVESWLNREDENYEITTIDMLEPSWEKYDFSLYDVVFHVAGIAHSEIKLKNNKGKHKYYQINTNLSVEVAKKAQREGVKQFIFMSSMIIYNGCKEEIITKNTLPKPANFYGDSKWKAEKRIQELSNENFKIVILRPPMIYGRGSKGNYVNLKKIASIFPIFPLVKNERSMIYIDNFSQFVKLMIDNEEFGIFFPQNKEYVNTSEMVKTISNINGHKILLIPGTNILVNLLKKMPGRLGKILTKAFGNYVYDKRMSEYKEDYRIYNFFESISLSECINKKE